MGQLVEVSTEEGVATVTLANPDRRNALSLEMMTTLRDTFDDLAAGTSDVIVLGAQGPVFSAGHDFADIAGADLGDLRRLLRTCTRLMDAIREAPQPVIARVHGLATAAGCQLVATCDLAVASASAGFAAPGGKGGLFCHTPMVAISRNVSRKHALEMALSGDVIDASTAERWGLVNSVVGDDDLDNAVADLARRVRRGSPLARAMGKQVLHAQVDLPIDAAYDLAIEAMAANAAAPDGREGVASFLHKRPPRWSER